MSLRDYQLQCLAKSKERYEAGVNRQLAVLATGGGKTRIAGSLRTHHGFTKKVMFLVHMETLATQACDKFAIDNPGSMIGVEMANQYASPMDDFVIASVPTLGRKGSDRLRRFDRDSFSAIIQDEAHCGMADSFKRVYDHFGLMKPDPQGPLFLGITATPNRSDGQGLKALFDEIIFDWGIQKGIESGYLCDLRAFRVSGKANLDKVKTRLGEFAQDELADTVNTPERNAIIVKEWYKHAYGRRTIVFTVDVQHALDIAEAFKAHGVQAKAVWGDDPERQAKLRGHQNGEFEVICCAALLSIGYDDPQVSCIVQAAPRKSFVRYAQEIGRGTRIFDGKPDCLILDIVDNSQKHNLCTISSLLGLPKDLDLKGEKFTTAKQKLERIAAEFPSANVQDVKSLAQLDSMAENISLFKVSYPPEIKQLSELAWRASGDGYMLAVNRELVTLTKDLRDEWWVKGNLGGKQQEVHLQNLAGAFNAADRIVSNTVGSGKLGMLMRDVRWRNDPPTTGQVALCKKLGLSIPQGATKGMVSAAIDARLGSKAPPTRKPIDDEYHGEF